jgi:peptidoglycan/LPS O-acetylase OafA/YrhL
LRSASSTDTSGGLSWASILYVLWEPFVAWGLIAAWLLIFRERMNRPSAFWSWLNRRAYAAYIIHPPVLVGIALLLHGWAAPALVKFAVVGTLACMATWLLADQLVRLPGVRHVV